jgi:hypothetical protein
LLWLAGAPPCFPALAVADVAAGLLSSLPPFFSTRESERHIGAEDDGALVFGVSSVACVSRCGVRSIEENLFGDFARGVLSVEEGARIFIFSFVDKNPRLVVPTPLPNGDENEGSSTSAD